MIFLCNGRRDEHKASRQRYPPRIGLLVAALFKTEVIGDTYHIPAP